MTPLGLDGSLTAAAAAGLSLPLNETHRRLMEQAESVSLGEQDKSAIFEVPVGILLRSIPMVGAWAASKWMIPWADKVGGASEPVYKAITQGWWALGAVLGSFFGAQIAAWLGRRRAYAIISVRATALTSLMFLGTAPLQATFLPIVFALGFVTTLFLGWLPLYLPELFPTRVRANGSGIAYNVGRFATALGLLMAGALFAARGGLYAKVGATCGLIYPLGLIAIRWAPDTTDKKLDAS